MPTSMPPSARAVLEEARQAHIAVEPQSGPHITPALYSLAGDRIWMVGAVTTVKAKALARNPVAAAAIAVSGRAVLVRGEVEAFDPRRPGSLLSGVGQLPALAHGMARYGLRNAPDLVGFSMDLARGRMGRTVPPVRAVFALAPSSGAVMHDGMVIDTWGEWPSDSAPGTAARDEGERSIMIAVPGPIALPAFASTSGQHVRVPSGLVDLLPQASRFAMAWVVDDYGRPGPAAKSGLLGRGVAERTSDPAQLTVRLDRLVEWHGASTSSVEGPQALTHPPIPAPLERSWGGSAGPL